MIATVWRWVEIDECEFCGGELPKDYDEDADGMICCHECRDERQEWKKRRDIERAGQGNIVFDAVKDNCQ